MELLQNKKGDFFYKSSLCTSRVHIVHCSDNIYEIKSNTHNPYIVVEECTGYTRSHLVTSYGISGAMTIVNNYLSEREHIEGQHILAVWKLKINIKKVDDTECVNYMKFVMRKMDKIFKPIYNDEVYGHHTYFSMLKMWEDNRFFKYHNEAKIYLHYYKYVNNTNLVPK